MDILVLYKSYRLRERRTMRDHLYSFARYVDDCRFVYLDVGDICGIPRCIAEYPFDAVLFHYSFLALRLDEPVWNRLYTRLGETLKRLYGVKALLPHDEYLCAEALWQLASDCSVKRIFTSCYPHDYNAIFPSERVDGDGLCRTVLTGYVDEMLQRQIDVMLTKKKRRRYDIGYRALRSNYIFGRHGNLKTEVADAFNSVLPDYPGLRADIRMTSDGYGNTITGNNWLRYLLDCRAAIGCLGGSSLLDTDGKLRKATHAFILEHPNADCEAVAAACYPGQDGDIAAYLLGPRHFECAMTKTCQLLVEGDYHGVLAAGRDYIEVKRDFSNIDEVLTLVADGTTCERIAQQCYEDVVQSGKYTYRTFANAVIDDIRSLCATDETSRAKRPGLCMAKMRAVAALAHVVNQCRNAAVNAAKAFVVRLTRGNPALYKRIKEWYKNR